MEEKIGQNRFRFSREITLGDLLLALALGLPLVVGQVRLYDTVQDHEKRIGTIEVQQVRQDGQIMDVQQQSAISADRLARMKNDATDLNNFPPTRR